MIVVIAVASFIGFIGSVIAAVLSMSKLTVSNGLLLSIYLFCATVFLIYGISLTQTIIETS